MAASSLGVPPNAALQNDEEHPKPASLSSQHPFLNVVEEWLVRNRREWPHRIPEMLHGFAQALNESADDDEALPYRFGSTPHESRRIVLTACVMATVSRSTRATKQFYQAFKSFFRWQLDQFKEAQQQQQQQQYNDDDHDVEILDPEEEDEENRPNDGNVAADGGGQADNTTTWQGDMETLGWLQASGKSAGGGLLRHVFLEAVEESVLVYVRHTIASDYETPLLESLLEWHAQIVQPWMQKHLSSSSNKEKAQQGKDLMACAFLKVRLEEIFDMVAEFPDSLLSIQELRTVLLLLQQYDNDQKQQPHQSSSAAALQVADALRDTLIRRLNHPGANTLQIIDVYINTIKVLRLLDTSHNGSNSSSDQLLTRVAEPVRQYLQGRHDTVRCIIASLTNAEQGGDLYEELKRQDAKPLEDGLLLDSDDEGDCLPDHLLNEATLWQPPPSIHAQLHDDSPFLEPARGGSSGGKNSDILAMLVSIYGSKELFVNEYRLMLADKLLSTSSNGESTATDSEAAVADAYNTDQQVHTLELLKLRFGEMSMRACEIMLKDLNDSKRTNANLRSVLPSTNVVDAMQISHIFWPALQRDALIHHPTIQYQLDQFGREYARLKNPRQLTWLYPLGLVQLELDVQDDNGVFCQKTFDCSPPLASLLMHFTDEPQWTAPDLSNETGLPVHTVQKHMAFWIHHRVVKVVPGTATATYVLAGRRSEDEEDKHDAAAAAAHHHHASHHHDDPHHHHHDGGAVGAVSVAAHEEEEMTVFTSYIVGMLTNLGQLPLKTIHNNLKTFVTGSDVKYSKTPQQLSAFLQVLCRQETLECGPDGLYKVLKKSNH